MPKPKYHSYLIRLWRESREKPNWRFVLVNLTNNAEQGFTSLDRLTAFLKEQMDELASSNSMERDQVE